MTPAARKPSAVSWIDAINALRYCFRIGLPTFWLRLSPAERSAIDWRIGSATLSIFHWRENPDRPRCTLRYDGPPGLSSRARARPAHTPKSSQAGGRVTGLSHVVHFHAWVNPVHVDWREEHDPKPSARHFLLVKDALIAGDQTTGVTSSGRTRIRYGVNGGL